MIEWVPKTKLGVLVAEKKITTIHDALESGYPLKEWQIVDMLIPNLVDNVLDINMVQRMTDSGRRTKFAVTVVVGNGDGIVGIGRGKAKETGIAINKALIDAKLHIIEIKRGCGSWQCGCGEPHTLPFKVVGKSGSVEVVLNPAPRGVGLAVSDVAKPILHLAGIFDAWELSKGHTKTTVNFAYSVFNALQATAMSKMGSSLESKLKIREGISEKCTLTEEELKAKSENANKGNKTRRGR